MCGLCFDIRELINYVMSETLVITEQCWLLGEQTYVRHLSQWLGSRYRVTTKRGSDMTEFLYDWDGIMIGRAYYYYDNGRMISLVLNDVTDTSQYLASLMTRIYGPGKKRTRRI